MDIPADKHARSAHDEGEADLYLPPRRLRRYQINKIVVATIVVVIFSGWLILQWSNPWMRWCAAGLLVVTAYVTIKSIVTDLQRARGRQIALHGGHIVITQPGGQSSIPLDAITEMHWRNDISAKLGLWLMDRQGRSLAHLNEDFLQDEREALTFLHWLRDKTGRTFATRWP